MNDVGLRARKMARTRDQIAAAAIHLFVEQGYDATTLEEVAERADVHKRTLLRYFPTKAHLVLHPQYAAIEEFRETLANRGDRLTVDLWTDHVVIHARDMAKRGRLANTRQIARTEPAVEGAFLSIQAAYQGMIVEGLLADLKDYPNAEILARVAASALVGGNYAVGAMIFGREAYAELETAELEVVRLVRQELLHGRFG
jgi:AcrR family transcriptional regulator